MAKREGNNGNHGNANSGRKPLALTILKRRLVEERTEDTRYAYDFFAAAMHSEELPYDQRAAAAREILDRNIGKPVQATVSGGDEAYREHMERLRKTILGELGQTSNTQSSESGSGTAPTG